MVHFKLRYSLIICLITTSLFTGCGTSKLGSAEFINYINDDENGISKTIDKEEISIKVTYYPYQIFVYRELQGLSGGEKKKILEGNQYESIYSKNVYFMITLKSRKESSEADYGFRQLTKRLQPICSGVGTELTIYLQSGNEKRYLNYMSCETNQSLSGEIKMLIAFERPKENESLKLHIEGLYDETASDFEYNDKDIKRIPVLDFNS